MDRANPADMRKAMESAQILAKHGIFFVCIPVEGMADREALFRESAIRLERIAVAAEEAEAAK